MSSFKQLALVCLISACFFSCKSDTKATISANEITDTYAHFISDMDSLGIATGNILVYDQGKVIFKSSRGLRSINPIDSLSLDDQFRLASVSKQFTGMAIMKLKEAEKLDYDQNVQTILTDFPYDNITIRHLLYHTSGLTDYERLIAENFVKSDTTKTYILGNDEILKEFYRVDPPLDFQPGDKWEYSNTGYMVLASIVEKVSGQHFRTFLKEQITEPLGMTNTTLYKYQQQADPNMPNRVFGYRKKLNQEDLELNDYDIVNDVRGDGGIYSTLDDLYKWNMALVNHTIISKDYLDEAWTPGTLNNGEVTEYGFGWFIEDDTSKPQTVFHSGGWVGFGTFLFNEVETKSGFIMLTNNTTNYYSDILTGIATIRAGGNYELPKNRIHNEMAKLIFKEDVNKAISHYHQVKTDTLHYEDFEEDLNQLGYQLLNENRIDDALAIFKLNTKEFPNSANTYDSYADALVRNGDTLNALKNYRKCIEMDSTLQYAQDKVEALEIAYKFQE
ncbi:serine hydrolase [Psychroserpens sp. BH13MA-6]